MSTLTAQAKDELVKEVATRHSARVSEVAAIIRFAGKLDIVGGGLVIEVDLDHEGAIHRLSGEIKDLYGITGHVLDLGASATRKAPRYILRVTQGSEELLRRVGLVSRSGHRIVGLPPQVISGLVSDAEAAWRGAFLAAGHLSDPGRSSGLEISCPSQEASLALVGCARRLGLSAKTKETRGVEKAVIRDGVAVGALLSRMGANVTRLAWDKLRLARETKPSGNRLANFDDANLRRSAQAAEAAARRVERAIVILDDDVPDHLAEAGQLRMKNREASLEELGRLAEPPMTKDAIAGRIRRLLSLADARAQELGIPDTHGIVQ